MQATENLNIQEIQALTSPEELKAALPMNQAANATVVEGRDVIKRILSGEDPRLLAIVGPCSIHDPKAALEYAERLKALREAVGDSLCILMRVYFEKPRTTIGWKGFINDPFLN